MLAQHDGGSSDPIVFQVSLLGNLQDPFPKGIKSGKRAEYLQKTESRRSIQYDDTKPGDADQPCLEDEAVSGKAGVNPVQGSRAATLD